MILDRVFPFFKDVVVHERTSDSIVQVIHLEFNELIAYRYSSPRACYPIRIQL